MNYIVLSVKKLRRFPGHLEGIDPHCVEFSQHCLVMRFVLAYAIPKVRTRNKKS